VRRRLEKLCNFKRAQHSTAQHSTAQHSTAQHSTAQHGTAQHSAPTRQHEHVFALDDWEGTGGSGLVGGGQQGGVVLLLCVIAEQLLDPGFGGLQKL